MTSCIDCPDLDKHPGDIQPRARCCRDEHIDRRLAGSFDPWEGIEAARLASAEDEARESRFARMKAEFQGSTALGRVPGASIAMPKEK